MKSGEKDILKTNERVLTSRVNGTPPDDIIEFFRSNDGFCIVAHLSPDGDALGSACALGMALEHLGKRVILLCRDRVPAQYEFLPGMERFLTFDGMGQAGIDLVLYKNLVLVDCNEIKRTGLEKSVLAPVKFVRSAVVDHHETESAFGDLRWVVPPIAATGMMVYFLIKALGVTITEQMAANLYAALVVDTGNFRFPNTSPDVLRVAADLAESGAKPHLIYKGINESWSEGRFRLFVRTLETFSIADGVAMTYVTKKMFDETGTTPDDTENFASFALTMKDIKVAVFIREAGDRHYKISLRSIEDINVEKVAATYGGGGHKNAAGCLANGGLAEVKAELMKKLVELSLR